MREIIAHEIEPGVFVPWPSGQPITKTCRTETVIVRREDGSEHQEDRACEPYTAVEKVPATAGDAFWKNHSDAELANRSLYRVEPFTVPEAKRRVGAQRFERDAATGVVRQVFDVEDIPPPLPEPTPEEKLVQAGLTLADFDALIAKSMQRQIEAAQAGGTATDIDHSEL